MFGQNNESGRRYYRHAHKKRDRKCDKPVTYVPAEELERAVMAELFEAFGNPKGVERAIQKAIPNLDKINKLRERIGRIDDEVESIAKGRERLIARLAKDTIDEAEADRQLIKSKDRRDRLQEERTRLTEGLNGIPDPAQIKKHGKAMSASMQALIRAHRHAPLEEMSYEDRRALVEQVFSGTGLDGRRLGVYVEPGQGSPKRFRFTIHGHLIEREGLTKSACR